MTDTAPMIEALLAEHADLERQLADPALHADAGAARAADPARAGHHEQADDHEQHAARDADRRLRRAGADAGRASRCGHKMKLVAQCGHAFVAVLADVAS